LTPFAVSLLMHRPATTAIHTLSLHDALPISEREREGVDSLPRGHYAYRRGSEGRRESSLAEAPPAPCRTARRWTPGRSVPARRGDRKSTRLNSSHVSISYAVFCLKKKKKKDG